MLKSHKSTVSKKVKFKTVEPGFTNALFRNESFQNGNYSWYVSIQFIHLIQTNGLQSKTVQCAVSHGKLCQAFHFDAPSEKVKIMNIEY